MKWGYYLQIAYGDDIYVIKKKKTKQKKKNNQLSYTEPRKRHPKIYHVQVNSISYITVLVIIATDHLFLLVLFSR